MEFSVHPVEVKGASSIYDPLMPEVGSGKWLDILGVVIDYSFEIPREPEDI
jgi:hypothetical protein